MKRILLLLAIVGAWALPAAAVPSLVHVSGNPTTDSASGITGYTARLPMPAGNNNGLIFGIDHQSGVNVSGCADDKLGTWTLAKRQDDGNQVIELWFSPGRTDAPQVATCSMASTRNFTAGVLMEFAGLATSGGTAGGGLDRTCGGNFLTSAAAFTLDCTTAATITTGEVIIAYGTQTDVATTRSAWVEGSGYTRLNWDTLDSNFLEWKIGSSATAENPGMGTVAAQHGVIAAATFMPAATGTLLTGFQPVSVFHFRLKSTDTAPTFQIPCRGDENAILEIWNGAAGKDVTGNASANTTGAWAQAGSGTGSIVGPGLVTFWYLENGTCGPTSTVTPTLSGAGAFQDSEIIFVTWINAATTFKDAATPVTTTYLDATGAAFSGSSITANKAGRAVAYIAAATGPFGCEATVTCSQVVGSPGVFISPQTIPVLATNPTGENQGAVMYGIAAGETYTPTWTPNGHPIGNSADYVAVFNAAGGSGGGAGSTGFFILKGR